MGPTATSALAYDPATRITRPRQPQAARRRDSPDDDRPPSPLDIARAVIDDGRPITAILACIAPAVEHRIYTRLRPDQ